jgi:hypothetical protein
VAVCLCLWMRETERGRVGERVCNGGMGFKHEAARDVCSDWVGPLRIFVVNFGVSCSQNRHAPIHDSRLFARWGLHLSQTCATFL